MFKLIFAIMFFIVMLGLLYAARKHDGPTYKVYTSIAAYSGLVSVLSFVQFLLDQLNK